MPTQRENEQHEAVSELLMALRQLMTAPDVFERLGLRDFQEFFSHVDRWATDKVETKARALAARVTRSLERGEHPYCKERLRDVHRAAEVVVGLFAES